MGLYQDWILPRLIHLAMKNRDLAPYRRRVLPAARGRVLEIGIGSGLNLPFYSRDVAQVFGLDPSPELLRLARGQADHAPFPVQLIDGTSEAIPLDERSIDTVVTTWTLCSVPDVNRALAEVRRVLKPGGRLLFVEHGLSPEPRVERWQHRLTPLWRRVAGGCHLNRKIDDLIRSAGFRINHMETGYMKGPRLMTYMYEGSAVRYPST